MTPKRGNISTLFRHHNFELLHCYQQRRDQEINSEPTVLQRRNRFFPNSLVGGPSTSVHHVGNGHGSGSNGVMSGVAPPVRGYTPAKLLPSGEVASALGLVHQVPLMY